jgi:hypothetical protein
MDASVSTRVVAWKLANHPFLVGSVLLVRDGEEMVSRSVLSSNRV